MNDKMFAFMSKIASISTSDGRFDLSAAHISDVDLPHLEEAQLLKWVVVKPYASRITPAGMKAFLEEKRIRDDNADNRGNPTSSKTLVILGKIAVWLVGAVVTALIAQYVSALFQ